MDSRGSQLVDINHIWSCQCLQWNPEYRRNYLTALNYKLPSFGFSLIVVFHIGFWLVCNAQFCLVYGRYIRYIWAIYTLWKLLVKYFFIVQQVKNMSLQIGFYEYKIICDKCTPWFFLFLFFLLIIIFSGFFSL